MKYRPFWINKIYQAWETRPIVWLSGVRRVGKTSVAKMLPHAIYLNCDLPSVVRRLEDPESYLKTAATGATIIFDEIHRLADPSNLLKIAADEYPHLKILATGSSTLEATQKFKDSLTGRKNVLYLPPVLWDECKAILESLTWILGYYTGVYLSNFFPFLRMSRSFLNGLMGFMQGTSRNFLMSETVQVFYSCCTYSCVQVVN
jgi:hypothetical protein